WTQGDTVVGYSTSPFAEPAYQAPQQGNLEPGTGKNVHGEFKAQTYRCDSPAAGPWRTLDAGACAVYPVVRVVGSFADPGVGMAPVDVTLVDEPLAVTLSTNWYEAATRRVEAVEPAFSGELSCGMVVDRWYAYSERLVVWANTEDSIPIE